MFNFQPEDGGGDGDDDHPIDTSSSSEAPSEPTCPSAHDENSSDDSTSPEEQHLEYVNTHVPCLHFLLTHTSRDN